MDSRNLPKISVVTPSYNQGQYLEETILSVLDQGYPHLEYIIVDGGSTDGSIDIIKKYAHRLHYWVSEKDSGFGNAINKGFACATGDIFCWLNSDDLLLPGALQVIGLYFAKHPHTGVVFGDRICIDENSKLLYKKRSFFYLNGQLQYQTLPQEATFWRSNVFFRCGRLDESLKFAIDLDLWCKFYAVTKIRHIPFYLGAFRLHAQSKTSTINHIGKDERKAVLIKYFHGYFDNKKRKRYKWWISNLKRLYRVTGIHLMKMIYFKSILAK